LACEANGERLKAWQQKAAADRFWNAPASGMTLTTKRRRVASTTTDNRPAPMLPTPSAADRPRRWQVMLVKSSLGKLLTGTHDTNLAWFVCQAPYLIFL